MSDLTIENVATEVSSAINEYIDVVIARIINELTAHKEDLIESIVARGSITNEILDLITDIKNMITSLPNEFTESVTGVKPVDLTPLEDKISNLINDVNTIHITVGGIDNSLSKLGEVIDQAYINVEELVKTTDELNDEVRDDFINEVKMKFNGVTTILEHLKSFQKHISSQIGDLTKIVRRSTLDGLIDKIRDKVY